MIRQDYVSWIIGIAFSLAVHGVLFLQASAPFGVQQTQTANVPLTTRLNFIEKKQPESVEEVKPEPEKPKTKPKPKSKPKPVKPEPVKKQEIKPPEPEPVKQQLVKAQPKGQQTNQVNALLLKQQQQLYMHDLLTHIEGYKFYPRAARRRGVEGEVIMSFTLLANGRIQDLQASGEHSVLIGAAKQAMEEAVPLPLPPSSMTLPRNIKISIIYSLRY